MAALEDGRVSASRLIYQTLGVGETWLQFDPPLENRLSNRHGTQMRLIRLGRSLQEAIREIQLIGGKYITYRTLKGMSSECSNQLPETILRCPKPHSYLSANDMNDLTRTTAFERLRQKLPLNGQKSTQPPVNVCS